MPHDKWIERFLCELSQCPNVTAAARAAGVGRMTVYSRKAADPGFAAAWDDAVEQAIDRAAGEAYRRAVDGVLEPVFYRGKECGIVRKYSDGLIQFLLQAHRPAVYGKKVEQQHSGEVKVIIEYVDASSPDPSTASGAGGNPA